MTGIVHVHDGPHLERPPMGKRGRGRRVRRNLLGRGDVANMWCVEARKEPSISTSCSF